MNCETFTNLYQEQLTPEKFKTAEDMSAFTSALHDISDKCIPKSSTRSKRRNPLFNRGGRVVRRCWVNFQCRGVLLLWIVVGQGPIALAVGAGGGCLDIFSLIYHFSFLSPSLMETARYRLKYCLKGPLSPKNNQPTIV